MTTTIIILEVDHDKPIPDLLKLVEGRAYTLAGVKDTRARPHEPDIDYKGMFECAVISLSKISEALGVDLDEAACANGNELILEAIARKNEALLAALKR